MGTQPMPPSDSTIRIPGKRLGMCEYSQSVHASNELTMNNADRAAGSESVDGLITCDDEPTCRLTTVSVSSHAAKKMSQYPEWIDGSPSFSGFSLKDTAL